MGYRKYTVWECLKCGDTKYSKKGYDNHKCKK